MEHKVLGNVEGISISVDGNKVIAKMGNKVGIAKCSPEDKFDIFVGTKIALERLEEKVKPYQWLKDGVQYFYPDLADYRLYCTAYYDTNGHHSKIMKTRGLIFQTREEAFEVATKMLAVLKEG